MSRSDKIAVVECYLNGLARKDLASVPFAPEITFEGPRMPRLASRDMVVGFLTSILPFIKAIEIKQHIVEGDYVATVFDMETVNGVDHVMDLCHVVGGELTAIHSFYYPSQERSWTKTGQRWITQIALDGASNLVKEFWPDLNSKFFHNHY